MSQVRFYLLVPVIFLVLFCTTGCASQQSTLYVNHATGTYHLDDEPPRSIPEDPVTLFVPGEVEVRVTGTNTALYHHTLEAEERASSTVGMLQTFAGVLTPYATALRETGFRGGSAPQALPSPAAQQQVVARSVTDVETLLRVGSEERPSLADVHRRVLTAFDVMYRTPDRIDDARETLRRGLQGAVVSQEVGIAGVEQLRLVHTDGLVRALDDLRQDVAVLRAVLPASKEQDASAQEADQTLDTAQGLLADAAETIRYAYTVEKLAVLAVEAAPTWERAPLEVGAREDVDLELQVRPREYHAYRATAPLTFEARLRRRHLFRLQAGAAVAIAPGAQFSQFSVAAPDEAGLARVVRESEQDARLLPVVTLSATWQPTWLSGNYYLVGPAGHGFAKRRASPRRGRRHRVRSPEPDSRPAVDPPRTPAQRRTGGRAVPSR